MSKINRSEIYDKNINFLIGSGASAGLLPTLALELKVSGSGDHHSIETLATRFSEEPNILTFLFSWYVTKLIEPAAEFELELGVFFDDEKTKVVENYEIFISNILTLLSKKKTRNSANVFTTNYDGMIAHTAERMIHKKTHDFILNDGGSGFVKRTLNARTFNRYYQDQGVFDRHVKTVPQINLIQLHGSVYWYKDENNIEISYDLKRASSRVEAVPCRQSIEFENILNDASKTELDLSKFAFDEDESANAAFKLEYEKLPIVNPTKWKFHETVFEEHYYQMLRLLSYELEKPNSVFIAFGFSFADEHILNLVKRSLSNPTLQLFVCCFNEKMEHDLRQKFKSFGNVEFIRTDSELDFTAFNEQVFSSNTSEEKSAST